MSWEREEGVVVVVVVISGGGGGLGGVGVCQEVKNEAAPARGSIA